MTFPFRVKLLASHAAVAIAVGAVTIFVVERAVSQRMEAQVDRRLEAQAQAVARWTEQARHPDRLAGRLAGVVGARVTIIDEDGVAVGESRDHVEPEQAGQAETLAEVRAARAGKVGRATRFSPHDHAHVRYVAVPAPDDSVVRLGLPIGEIDETKSDLRRQLGIGAVASLAVALALAALLAAALSRRLRAARELAARIGAGDYDVAADSDNSDEVGVLSQTLVAAARELEANEARRRDFLANVAHEIRTPVTSIRGYAETLEQSDVDPETRREFVQTIHRNAVRIADLVEDLLELEALQAGKAAPLEIGNVDIGHVVGHVTDTLQARTDELSATVRTELEPALAARGDADAIERILLNLVDNALRHGGEGVTIDIDGRARGDRAVIEVRDDGPGIPPEHRSRIFERFHRGVASANRGPGGTGLGLAIARELAQAMDGNLTLDDSERGAAFRIELPRPVG